MKISISQPMYLPWPGLFDQVKKSDLFVHYDDVAFPQGRSFLSRVQIKIGDNLEWLTVPILKKTRGLVRNVEIDQAKDWKKKHFFKIQKSLANAPFFSDVCAILDETLHQEIYKISELNILFIEKISSYLGFRTEFIRSSVIGSKKKSTEKLLEISKSCGADHYLTGHGAKNYMDHFLFEKENIKVSYMDYCISNYTNCLSFSPYLTVLDLLAHKGKDSAKYLNSQLLNWKEFIKDE